MCLKRHKGFDGLSLNNLCPRGRSPLPKRAVADARHSSAFILSWNGEQDTEYDYEYKIQETVARLIVVTALGCCNSPPTSYLRDINQTEGTRGFTPT